MGKIEISEAMVADWKAERTREESEIARHQARVADLTNQINAAETLLKLNGVQSASPANGTPVDLLGEEVGDKVDMTGAIERIANNSPMPLKHPQVRAILLKEGFPEQRLGNYYYTVIKRLKDKDRITVAKNGSIWRKP